MSRLPQRIEIPQTMVDAPAMAVEHADALIVGGGFYGSLIADYLVRERGLARVVLLERENDLMCRASYNNQARVHNGYHYPRSFTTAYRSRVNLPQFVREWQHAVDSRFTKLYAIARRHSKVTSAQFQRFCESIGASCQRAEPEHVNLFDKRLIEAVYLTEEFAFDADRIRQVARERLHRAGVQVMLGHDVVAFESIEGGIAANALRLSDGSLLQVRATWVFNCTYAGLNRATGPQGPSMTPLKHEITEMPLVAVPEELQRIGVTVMDGPFFSLMPFPARQLHTLSHVRYTPHLHWRDDALRDPYQELAAYSRDSHFNWMIRDVARYMPSIANSVQRDSLFEVKTVLVRNEGDDGRPILFEEHAGLPGFYSVLGGKLDNIYEALAFLDNVPLGRAPLNQSTP